VLDEGVRALQMLQDARVKISDDTGRARDVPEYIRHLDMCFHILRLKTIVELCIRRVAFWVLPEPAELMDRGVMRVRSISKVVAQDAGGVDDSRFNPFALFRVSRLTPATKANAQPLGEFQDTEVEKTWDRANTLYRRDDPALGNHLEIYVAIWRSKYLRRKQF